MFGVTSFRASHCWGEGSDLFVSPHVYAHMCICLYGSCGCLCRTRTMQMQTPFFKCLSSSLNTVHVDLLGVVPWPLYTVLQVIWRLNKSMWNSSISYSYWSSSNLHPVNGELLFFLFFSSFQSQKVKEYEAKYVTLCSKTRSSQIQALKCIFKSNLQHNLD